jgi:hypothetical protein
VLDAGRTGFKYKVQQIKAEGDLVWSVGQFTVRVRRKIIESRQRRIFQSRHRYDRKHEAFIPRRTLMSPDEKGTLQERQGNFAHMYQWQGNELKFRVHAFTFLESKVQ